MSHDSVALQLCGQRLTPPGVIDEPGPEARAALSCAAMSGEPRIPPARAVVLVLLAAATAACGDRARGARERDYESTVDPGLRDEYYWAVVGNGTCGGPGEADVAPTLVAGSAQPDAERCDAARLGTVAVCWDGDRARHPQAAGEARCLFVGGDRAGCREGPGGGRIWECVRTDAE